MVGPLVVIMSPGTFPLTVLLQAQLGYHKREKHLTTPPDGIIC